MEDEGPDFTSFREGVVAIIEKHNLDDRRLIIFNGFLSLVASGIGAYYRNEIFEGLNKCSEFIVEYVQPYIGFFIEP